LGLVVRSSLSVVLLKLKCESFFNISFEERHRLSVSRMPFKHEENSTSNGRSMNAFIGRVTGLREQSPLNDGGMWDHDDKYGAMGEMRRFTPANLLVGRCLPQDEGHC
jgi:hypothetical protein